MPQLLRALQPSARLIVTLADPVRRTYSDYWFLRDDRTVARGEAPDKSPQQFHERAVEQVRDFQACVAKREAEILAEAVLPSRLASDTWNSTTNGAWFRASQM